MAFKPEKRVEEAKSTEKGQDGGMSISDNFAKALIAVLPSIAGGLFGGTEGAAAAAGAGIEPLKMLMEEETEAKRKALEREQKLADLKDQRDFNKFKMEEEQKFKTSEREEEQKFKTSEREEEQKFKTSEREAAQGFELEQAQKSAGLTLAQQMIDQRHVETLGVEKAKNIRLMKNSFEKKPEVVALKKSQISLTRLEALLANNSPSVQGLISQELAKGIAGEVANISEEERKFLSARHGWINQGVDFIENRFSGKSSKERIAELGSFIKEYRSLNSKLFKDNIVSFAKGRERESKAFGLTAEQMAKDLALEHSVQLLSREEQIKRRQELLKKQKAGK